jgi:uncharacterized protein YutE (UPF0331/DUF86 family)
MIDRERLAKYLQDLEGYLRRLAELQRYPEEEFLSNWRIHDLADRQLHLTLETFLMVGEIVISECRFRKPDTYADIPRILYENKVIGKQLHDELVDLARFRNVLVHGYLHLDHERVYQRVHTGPRIIEEFIDAIREYVAAQPPESDKGS